MAAIIVVFLGLGFFYLAYRYYARFLADKIYRLDPNFRTPAHECEDGVDFVPTNRHILMGHHLSPSRGPLPLWGRQSP